MKLFNEKSMQESMENRSFTEGLIEIESNSTKEDNEVTFVRLNETAELIADMVRSYHQGKSLYHLPSKPLNSIWILLTGMYIEG